MLRIYLISFLICFVSPVFAQQDIADARNMLGQSVTISGIVTNGGEFGRIRYLQDNTAGLAAYGSEIDNLQRGDSVTISGTVKDYRNLLEIDPITAVTIHSTGNKMPEPKVISINNISEYYEGQLIRINNVEISGETGTFQGNSNYTFSNEEGQAEFRINSLTPIVDEVIPAGSFDLIGICSQYSYNSNDEITGYQILPRDINDFVLSGSVQIVSPLIVNEITKTSLLISWETNTIGQSALTYGTENDHENWVSSVSGNSIANGDVFYSEARISDLEPGAVIFARGYTVNENDTAFTSVKAFASESNSSGKMTVYFNTPVDNSVSTGTSAINIGKSIEDTLIAYINRAEESIDLCIYNINNNGLSNISYALNDAYNKGVSVRVIACGTTAHLGVDDLSSEIPVLIGPDRDRDGIMHNKFLIFDALSSDVNKPYVWTGSTNLTEGQINTDANNVIVIQDQVLAKTFKMEFDEMWGSQGSQSNRSNSKFGNEKSDNTPHDLSINGKWVECYFSPSDGTNQKIISAIRSAEKRLDVASMLITRSDIANAIKDAKLRGLGVNILTNYENDNSSTVNSILADALGNGFVFDDNANGILHHKYAIIDHFLTGIDPLVITGSHNWSSSANEKNDENTLIIHDQEIANLYYQNFSYRFNENNGIFSNIVDNLLNDRRLKVFPNPVMDNLFVYSEADIQKIELFKVTGKLIISQEFKGINNYTLDVSDFDSGLYFIKIFREKGEHDIYKIIKR